MNDVPVYITISEIARQLGYVPSNVTALYRHWKDDPEHPCPAADAYSIIKGGHQAPLWLHHRNREWRDWNHTRKTLGRHRQAQAGRKPHIT